MAATIKPMSQTLQSSNLTFTSLHTTFSSRGLSPCLSIPSKPIKRHLSLSLSTPRFSYLFIQKKPFSSTTVSHVAAQGEQGEANTALQDIEGVGEGELEWGGQGVDGAQASLSDWESSGVDDGVVGEGEAEGGDFSRPRPTEELKLFVGNLPYDVDSEQLAQLFEPAGIVEVAEVIYNRQTNQSRGFGFVTMSTVAEADKAVEMFNRYDLNGRLLTVNKAAPRGVQVERLPRLPRAVAPTFRVFVGNLPWDTDKAELEEVFSKHGTVLDARVVYDLETGRSRGFGFVSMASEADMNAAVAAIDGQTVDGRIIRARVAEDRPRRMF
ncbi:hypothetical protein Dimus_023749 [Dionaea muscipula]